MAESKIPSIRALLFKVVDADEKLREWAEEHELARKLSAAVPLFGMLVVLALVALGVWVVWVVPQWQIERSTAFTLHGDPARQIELEDTLRKTLTQIVLGVFGLILLYFTWRRARAGDATVRIMEQGHITDRFTKAIEQLGALDSTGKPNIEVRLGAIYALERIALDSPRDHWSIMEILTAYVRQNSPRLLPTFTEDGKVDTDGPTQPRTDIQAILTVLRRRKRSAKRERPEHRLDLSNTWLRKAALRGSYLKQAIFSKADLRQAALAEASLQEAHLIRAELHGAFLTGADLQGAYLHEANLQGAYLDEANLGGANLTGANLDGAYLSRASFREASLAYVDLRNADLMDADLQGADLCDADLREARYLTTDQIRSATNWQQAKYADDMRKELGLPDEDDRESN